MTSGDSATTQVETRLSQQPPGLGDCALCQRASMFQCGENNLRIANDYRLEIHDSDRLAL
jgi:glucans biosynthesis protein